MSSLLRLELRRPRALDAALLALAALAAAALWLSAAPRVALLLVPLLLAAAWPRERAGGWRWLVLRGDGTAAGIAAGGDETELAPVRLRRRGPLTLLTLEAQGRMHLHLFTPDTLPRADARRLRLWFARHRPDDGAAAVPHV